jgi:HTH-type transcriptional regulator, transcriptional repressor of NAD biosynthesis genes
MNAVGLTLGKFASLHKGHEFLIQTAVEENERVIVIAYDSPDATSIPLTVRANWIRQLFPQVEVIEGWDGPPDTGKSPEVMKLQEDYVLGVLKGQKVTRFYSSEFYGEHMSQALNAENRQVDPERVRFPISGTAIRKNPFENRRLLSPEVYKDYIINVVFLGAPSTGKSTIAQDSANHFDTVWMPEYGREYWEKHQLNRRLSLVQLEEIAVGHIYRENEAIQSADRFLFTDTNAITTFIFSMYYHGRATERLTELAQRAEKRYDLYILCDLDIPYDDTWDRSGEGNRDSFQKQIIGDLRTRKVPYFTISGSRKERIEGVESILEGFTKFSNIVDVMDEKADRVRSS